MITAQGAKILQNELEIIKNEFNDFTYTVSHDLGTPLRSVVNFSRLLKERHGNALDEKGKCYLEFVAKGGEKAQAMLQGLLQYSRLSTRAKPHEQVEISTLVSKCHTVLKDKISACRGSLVVTGVLPDIEADPEQLFMLFRALLDNALTYHKANVPPQVYISAEGHNTHWKFMIEDNGIGIKPTDSTRIFELFKRLHTDEEYPGIGIGLTLARRIVEYHGGSIGTSPTDTGGTVFWFTIAKPVSGTSIYRKGASLG